VRTLGWRAPLLYGDPPAFDRWLWLRRHALEGPTRTLDAGSGNGTFSMYLASQGNEVTAISDHQPSQDKAARRARKGGIHSASFIALDLRRLDEFAGELGEYDQVVCLEVLEHILDDRKLVQDFARVVRPGGRLLVTTPYRHHVLAYKEEISPEENGGHVRPGYTHEELAELLGGAGFRVTSGAFLSGAVSQWNNNLMHRLNGTYRHLGWGLTFPLRILRPLDRPITRLTSHPYLAIGVVAVRG
jgi:cyclopropane fatty-acyl-phospholipid synthase-like methyltransferase